MRKPLGPARAEMFTATYWTGEDSHYPEADSLLMDTEAIRDFNATILADHTLRRTDIYHMDLPDSDTRDDFVTYNLTRPAYAKAAPQVRDNILKGLSAFGNDYEFGVCIARSVLLSLPVEGVWPTYKPYTLSPIHVNEGVIIYSVTADKKWYFVRTSIYYGWVSSRSIALCNNREEMKRYTDYEDFLVVTADHLTVAVGSGSVASHAPSDDSYAGRRTDSRTDSHTDSRTDSRTDSHADSHTDSRTDSHTDSHADSHANSQTDSHVDNHTGSHAYKAYITYDMGDRIKLTAHDARGYHVTVLTKDVSGHVQETDAIIEESADVHIGYLPYTQQKLLDQCFKTLDDRYMWGGAEGERDCSSWVMEIFSCFGLMFPRNSARQLKIPAYSLNLSGMDNSLKSEILSRLPAGTLIFSPSHVMVYLGRRGNDNYMIHNGGDFCVIKDTCDSTDRCIDKGTHPASEKYLTYGVTVMSLEKTTTLEGRVWLDAIISAVLPQTSDKYSILINKVHAFDEHYLDRVKIIKRMSASGEEKAIEKVTSEALDELIAFADTMGIKIGLCSGYRSVAYQQIMLDTYPEIYGEDYCPELLAQPGHSEHHTGLAVDLAICWDGIWLVDNYPDEAVAALERLHPYLHRFGFILRYPDGLEAVTGYPYEPWHLRYVGKSTAPAYFIAGCHMPFEQLS